MVTTRSGQRAVVEAVNEIYFPQEFDPPTVSFTTGADPTKAANIEPKAPRTQLAGIPTVFEGRHVGLTIEFNPTLSADGR